MSIPLTVPYAGPRCIECGQAGDDHANPRDCVDELKRQVARGATIITDLAAELRAVSPAYSDDGDRRASPPPMSGPMRTDAERYAVGSEERRVGDEGTGACRSGWCPVDSRLYAAAVVARDAFTDALRGRP